MIVEILRDVGVRWIVLAVFVGLLVAALLFMSGAAPTGIGSSTSEAAGSGNGLDAAAGARADEGRATHRFVQDGFAVELSFGSLWGGERVEPDSSHDLRNFDDAEIRFSVREAGGSGEPLRGLSPMAWIVSREADAGPLDRSTCKRAIQDLLAGRLSREAEVNFNEYLLVTLNDHASLSVIDPQVGSLYTKTIGAVTLTSQGADMALSPDRRSVLVSHPTLGQVASSDIDRRLSRHVDVGGRPWRIAFEPDGRFLWVGDEVGDEVTLLDPDELVIEHRFAVSPGPHRFAFDGEGRRAFVASPASSRIVRVDLDLLEPLEEIDLPAAVVDFAYSQLARQLYVALDDGSVAIVDRDGTAPVEVAPLEQGIASLDASLDGRWIFVTNSRTDRVTLFDAALRRPVFTIATEDRPGAVEFTETFAYILHAGTGEVVLVDLGALSNETEAVTATAVIGQEPLITEAREAGDRIAPIFGALPEGGGALILNEADRSVYHFMEGMHAPMGSYAMYPWGAVGLTVVDRTIRERDPGEYVTQFRAPAAGAYTVAFLEPGSPQIYGCFPVEIAGNPERDRPVNALEFEIVDAPDEADGEPRPLVVRVRDAATRHPVEDLEDLTIFVFRLPEWQWRHAASNLGGGLYSINVSFTEAGRHHVGLVCPSRDVELRRPFSHVEIGDATGCIAKADEPRATGDKPGTRDPRQAQTR